MMIRKPVLPRFSASDGHRHAATNAERRHITVPVAAVYDRLFHAGGFTTDMFMQANHQETVAINHQKTTTVNPVEGVHS